MDVLLTYALIVSNILCIVSGLQGPNVCNEQQNVTLTTRVKYQQPVSVKTYRWCFDIPPKCSSVHIEMRDKWKVQTDVKTKIMYFCCPGFLEENDKCLPKCRAGVTGDKCNEDCLPNKWGPSCSQDCRCPRNSLCDPKNGKCVCIDGWIGSNCDVPKEAFTKLSLIPITLLPTNKDLKPLFDWNTQTKPIYQTSTVNIIPTTTLETITTPVSKIPLLKDVLTTDFFKNETTSKPIQTEVMNLTKDLTSTTIIPKLIYNISTNTTLATIISSTNSVDKFTFQNETKANEKSTTDISSQIESPIPTMKISPPTMNNSPITVILHNVSNVPAKDIKNVTKATESSIISLTVLKSTAVSPKRRVISKTSKTSKQGDSDLIKITLHTPQRATSTKDAKELTTAKTVNFYDKNATKVDSVLNFEQPPIITVSPLDNNTFFTMITTDIQTEEVKHVLTEPEQITSVAEDSANEDSKDSLYSALSVGMGVAISVISIATIIVFVARYRTSYRDRNGNIDTKRMQQITVSEDELPSSYLRSVFHSPLPEIHVETTTLGINSHKTVTYLNPVLLHNISPMLMESFKEVLESHYDHPKPPRPASVSISTEDQQNNVSFGTLPSSFRPLNNIYKAQQLTNTIEVSFPVTGEAINALKLEQSKTHTLEMENLDPIYDEIPWRPNVAHAKEIVNDCDEAITEL